MRGAEGNGSTNSFSSEGLDGAKNKPTDVEILDHEGRERFGERSVAEIFGPLMGQPISEVGTERALKNLSIEAVSSRN